MVSTHLQIFHGADQPLTFEQRELEFTPGPGEVLVAIELATICGSDLHTLDGRRTEETPCVLGHEAVGTVVKTGPGRDLTIGDRVTWSIANSCGQCNPCVRDNLPQKCEQLFKYGHAPLDSGTGHNGCYASHIVLRAGTHIARIPDTVPNSVAAPANCALATMVNAIDQLPKIPSSVVVQGAGLLGLYGCALLEEAGVENIYCTEIDPTRKEWIQRFGGTPIDASTAEQEISKRHPSGIDVIFEVAGARSVVPEGVRLLRNGGTYIFIGLVHPNSELSVTAETIIKKCLTLRGIHNYAPQHLDAAVDFLERQVDQKPFESLVAPATPLEDLSTAVALAKSQQWARVSVAAKTP